MKRWWNVLTQGIGFTAQVIMPNIVPADWQTDSAAIVAAIQGIVAIIAHHYNPDGSPATEPYHKRFDKPTKLLL